LTEREGSELIGMRLDMKNKTRFERESGFVLVEVLSLLFFLLAISGSLLMYQTTAKAKGDAILRLTAMYLAQTELAHVEQIAARRGLSTAENFSWLGEPSDLNLNGGRFSVNCSVKMTEEDICLAVAEVKWPYLGRERKIILERLILDTPIL